MTPPVEQDRPPELHPDLAHAHRIAAEAVEWMRENDVSTPAYLLDLEMVADRYTELRESMPDVDIHYAIKANDDINLLKFLKGMGCNFEAVSIGEILTAREAGIKPEQIIFTDAGVPPAELAAVHESGVMINVDSLGQLKQLGELGAKRVSLRLNLDVSAGHHAKVRTGGDRSKFGIHRSLIPDAHQIAEQYGMKIVGLQQHIGSNYKEAAKCLEAMEQLFGTARDFDDLEFLDFGGGLGVPDHPGATDSDTKGLDIKELGPLLSERFKTFEKSYGRPIRCKFEPGRRPVAEAGQLLLGVTDRKENPHRTFVLTDSGFTHFIRTALYDSRHQIIAVGKPGAPTELVTVTGRVCETGDIFAEDIELPRAEAGDYLAILTTGAYGEVMATDRYNKLPLPARLLRLPGSRFVVSQRAETPEELVARFTAGHRPINLPD